MFIPVPNLLFHTSRKTFLGNPPAKVVVIAGLLERGKTFAIKVFH